MSIGNAFIGDVEQLLVNDVISSKNLFRFSKETYKSYSYIFEEQVKEMFNACGVIILPSATLALVTFLKTLNLNSEDEVILPPLSWVADYSALLFEDVNMRFCQIDESLQVDVSSIKALANKNTKVILIPHLMGRGQQNIDEIAKFCKENNVVLIEDIAQAFGVKVKGKYAGSYGDFAFTSFNHHKLLSTGDGGAAIVFDDEVYKAMCQIHDQGCLIDDKGKRKPVFKEYAKGYSLRVNNLTSAIALAQLSRFSLIKHSINEKYRSFIERLPDEYIQKLISCNDGDISYTALFKAPFKKDYPSMLDSGWHFIENIPYFDRLSLPDMDKKHIKYSKSALKNTFAIGTGFIDKYYAIVDGITIFEEITDNKIKQILGEK